MLRNETRSWAVVAHTCNPSTLGGRGRRIYQFEASLVYRVSSRTAKSIERNPALREKKNKTKQQTNKQNKTNKQTNRNEKRTSMLGRDFIAECSGELPG